jgi:Helicase conserved C-terminal domain./Sel1 repeat.
MGKDGKMKQIKTNEFSLTKEFTDILTDKGRASVSQIIKNIHTYSCKFAQAIQEIILHPKENTFVYSKFVYGSGAILFGELLKLVGFSRTRARESVEAEEKKKEKNKKGALEKNAFGKDEMTDKDFNNLLTQEMAENQQETQEEQKDIEPTTGKRYAIITGETAGETEIDRVLDKFNSSKNKYGEYIQVIIGSQVIGEGKSLNNVRRIIVLTPHWNNSETEQAIARGIRAFSHEDLPKKEQVVHVYRYVAQTPAVKSIDSIMYKTSEDKDLLIKQLERVCKESAVDCALNYKRNKLSSDTDGSRECEYQSCQYTCHVSGIGANPKLIEDTYNLFYAEDTIENLIHSIQQLFRTRFSYDLVELTTNLPDISQIIMIRSLKMMIEKSIPIINRYGLTSYLREENNFYFLVDKIEYPASFPLEYYNRFPNIQPKIHFPDIVSISEYKYFGDISSKIQHLDPVKQRDDIIKIITGLKTDLKEMFFEYAIIASLLNIPRHVELRNLIIGIFTNSTFQMEDGSFVSLIDENNSKCLPSKAIKDFTKSKDVSVLKWRACNDSDKQTISSHKTGIKSSLEKNEYGCYGKVGENQKFRIKFLEEHKDTRKNSTGIVCSTINPKERIFELLVKVKADPPDPLNIKDRAKPIRELLSNKKLPYTEKQLLALTQKDFERIYYWNTKVQKQVACKALQDWFEQHNLLVYEESDKKKKNEIDIGHYYKVYFFDMNKTVNLISAQPVHISQSFSSSPPPPPLSSVPPPISSGASVPLSSVSFTFSMIATNEPEKWFSLGHQDEMNKNFSDAVLHYTRALELGCQEAEERIIICQHRFQREQFLTTLDEVSRGNYFLEFMLGCMYESGIGVAKNMNEAIRLFQKGSRRGDYSSMMKLMTLQLESGLK